MKTLKSIYLFVFIAGLTMGCNRQEQIRDQDVATRLCVRNLQRIYTAAESYRVTFNLPPDALVDPDQVLSFFGPTRASCPISGLHYPPFRCTIGPVCPSSKIHTAAFRHELQATTKPGVSPKLPEESSKPDKTKIFSIVREKPVRVAFILAHLYGACVCFEEKPDNEKNAEDRVSFAFRNATLDEVFNLFRPLATGYTIDTGYYACRDGEISIYNIYPANGSHLDWKIDGVSIADKTISEIFDGTLSVFKQHGFEYSLRNPDWMRDHKISLHTKDKTARQVLNLLCAEFSGQVRWSVFGSPGTTNATILFENTTMIPE